VGFSFEDMPAHLRNAALFEHVRAGKDPVALPFAAGSFDAVFSIGVLEHVHEAGGNPEASMKEIERIVKPGGFFFCFHLPNRYTWIEFMVRTVNRFFRTHLHQHSRLYSKAEFEQLLEGTSFEILESGRYNFLPRNQLNHLPAFMAESPAVARAIDALDGLLAAVLPWFCQNWYFLLKKRHAA
jgi:SAM-dependent methyltransferase